MFRYTKKILIAASLLTLCSEQLYAMNSHEQDSAARGVVSLRPTQVAQEEEPPQQVASAFGMFSTLPAEIKRENIEFLAMNVGPNVLRLVCREWRDFIDTGSLRNNNRNFIQRGHFWKTLMKGYVLQRFLGGKLIYRPKPESDEGMIVMPIAALENPLHGRFDLSQCGDEERYVRISTGYRTVSPRGPIGWLLTDYKVEIWFVPHFLIEENLTGSAAHFQRIMGRWNAAAAPVGVLWTWGGWLNHIDDYDDLTSQSMERLGNESLYQKQRAARGRAVLYSHREAVRILATHCPTKPIKRRLGDKFWFHL